MKKITLLILTFFLSFLSTYGQVLTESFDGVTTPNLPGFPSTSGSGWKALNNGLGLPRPFVTFATGATPASSLPNSAMSERYLPGMNATSLDYLVTPVITVPANGQMQFRTRTYTPGDQGGLYQIRVAVVPAGVTDLEAFQNNRANYSEPIVQWNETEINEAAFVQKTVPLTAYANQRVFIAFVRQFTQTTASLFNVDQRWLIDDVVVAEKCKEPTDLQSPTINMTNAILRWTNPGTATRWEIVVAKAAETLLQGQLSTYSATGTTINFNTLTNGTPLITLLPDTDYKYYVRAVCSDDNKSDWTLPYYFTTASLGETCADPIVMPQIPYTATDNTSNSNDRTDVMQAGACGAVPVGTNYMAGNEVFYTFVAPTTGEIRVEMTPTGPNSSIFIYNSCANVGVSCIAGVANTTSNIRVIPALSVVAGQTYVVVISSSAASQTVGYYLELQYVTCAEPTNLGTGTITQTSAILNWTPALPTSTEWQIAVQTAGSTIPTTPGVSVSSSTTAPVTTLLNGTALQSGTMYQYWVREACTPGGTTYSPWAGPYQFFTPICVNSDQCAHRFTMTGTNGWQGAVMHVKQNGITVAVLGPQFTTGTSFAQTVQLCKNIPFELVWVTGGNAQATVGVAVRNFFSQLLYQKGAGVGAPSVTPLYTDMVDCDFPKCFPPLSHSATGVTTNSATLNWNPAALTTQWEVYYAPTALAVAPLQADAVNPANLTSNTSNSLAVTGLYSDTPYVYYIRAVCGPGRTSAWIGPITFTTAASCGVPINLLATSQTTTGATLQWTQPALGSSSQWEIIVQGLNGPVPLVTSTAGVLVSSNSYVTPATPGLTPATQYEFYVRAKCSGTDVSRWAGPFVFSTLCNPVSLPYIETFDSDSPRKLCWTPVSVAGANTWDLSDITNPFLGNQSASFTPNNGVGNDDYLISPTLTMLPNYRVRFRYRVANATAANNIEILLSTGGISPAAFTNATTGHTLLSSTTWNNVTYQERVINLDAFASGNVNIAWHVTNANNANKIYIDQVIFEPIPGCPDPMDLLVSNVTSTSAELKWTKGFQETQWQVVVQTAGTGVPAAGVTGVLTTNNLNYVAQPLQPGNNYEYYVRAYCSATQQSQWVGPIPFRTLLCETADLCAYTFTMTDTASNGWGSTMTIRQNGLVVATLSGPANGSATAIQVVNFCPGVQFELFWDAGTSTPAQAVQVGVSITNSYGDVVYTKPPGTGTLNSRLTRQMPFCSAITCPYPTNLSVLQTSGTSVTLNWTPGGIETQWQYIVQPAGGNYPGTVTGNIVNTLPTANVRSLTAAVPYEYYVRAICGTNDLSYWSGPFFFTIYNSPGCIGVDIDGIDISVGAEIEVCPNDLCVDLSATYFQTQATTTYRVQSIPYLPPYPFTGGTPIPIGTDDDWTDTITLPFNFCFFGNTFNKLLITDNGALSFSIAGQVPGGRYTPLGAAGYQYNQPVPSNPGGGAVGPPYVNAVFGVLQDLYPGGSPADFSINYQVLGTEPCRAFVVSFYKAAHFSCTTDLETSQIVLYEGSNMIDIYVEDRTPCTTFNSGSGLIGLQNGDATIAITPPGRNTGTWSATNEAWRFLPDGALSSVQFEWRKDGRFYSNDLNINVCVTDTTLMEAVALYDKCDGTSVVRKSEVTIRINEMPIAEPINLSACAGVATLFDLTQNNAVILATVPPANLGDYTVSYFLTSPEAEVGTVGNLNGAYTTAVDTQIFVRIFNSVTGCFEIKSFMLQPNQALPAFSVTGDLVICAAESTAVTVVPTNFNLPDVTFVWTLPDGTVSDQVGSTFNITPANAQAGDYTVKVVNGNNCATTIPFTLVISPNGDPNTLFSYTTPICKDGTNPLPIPTTGFAAGGTYSLETGTGLVFVSTTTGEIDLTASAPGVYQVKYLVTATSCSTESFDVADIVITALSTPEVGFTYAAVCQNAANPLPVATLPGFVTGGTYSSTEIAVNAVTGQVDLTGVAPGSYTVNYDVAQNAAQCSAAGSSFAEIVVNSGINPITTFTYIDDNFCSDANSILPLGTFDAGGQFTASPATGLALNATTGEINFANSTPGTYIVTYTITGDAAVCRAQSSTPFTVTVADELTVTVENECVNNDYILTASPQDASYTYVWRNEAGNTIGTNSGSLNVSEYVRTLSTVVYPFNVTVSIINDGCESTQPFTVNSTFCNIQKGISPNGDDLNDSFDLTGFNVRKLSIYNRYGKEVYSFKNYTDEWKGQSDKGDELPDATYFYVIEREGVPSQTGWIQINRQRN